MEPVVNAVIEPVDTKKCFSCGKVFRTPANLLAHKNRKTPCLIREVTPEQAINPNRCIFCNKIFSQPQTLTRHLKICKIKNGGMEILVDKVRWEQEIRILKEQREVDAAAREADRKAIQQLKEELQNLKNGTQIVNNNTINYAPVYNIMINNYITPTLAGLTISPQEITNATNLSKLLLQKIYFNEQMPQNHCIYLMNKKDKSLIVFRDSKWDVVAGDNIMDVITKLSNAITVNGTDLLNGHDGPYMGKDDIFKNLPNADREKIYKFNTFADTLSRDDAYEVFLGGRDVVIGTIKAAGCKLV